MSSQKERMKKPSTPVEMEQQTPSEQTEGTQVVEERPRSTLDEVMTQAERAYAAYMDAERQVAKAYHENEMQVAKAYKRAESQAYRAFETTVTQALKDRDDAIDKAVKTG